MNKLYKFLFTLIIVFIGFLGNLNEVKGYEFTENSYYIKLDESSIGEITIYVPADKVSFLSLSQNGTSIINISSGSFYGYFVRGNTEYRVTFPSFDTPTYRPTSGTSITSDLDVESIIDTNINLDNVDYFINDSFVNQFTLGLSAFGVVVLCLILWKR